MDAMVAKSRGFTVVRFVAVFGAVVAGGCQRPPDAPETLDDLCAYLYEHHPDEDTTAVAAGLSNLDTWLDENWDEMEDGFSVSGLTQETVDAVDGTSRSVEGIFGVAAGTRSVHSVEAAADAMLAVDQATVAPESYGYYEREYVTDLDCFLDYSCERLITDEHFEALLPLGITSDNHAINEYLWAELDGGRALLQRSWLGEPPDVNFAWLKVDEQYYVNALLPGSDGHVRMQTTWMVNTQDDVPEGTVMTMVVQGMEANAARLDEYLDGD